MISQGDEIVKYCCFFFPLSFEWLFSCHLDEAVSHGKKIHTEPYYSGVRKYEMLLVKD